MDNNCTVYMTADFLAKRWSIVIIYELYRGKRPLRFSELKKRIAGITAKVLSQRLKELAGHGLIDRSVISDTVPIETRYSLTGSGKGLIGVIKRMKKWALDYSIGNPACDGRNCRFCEF